MRLVFVQKFVPHYRLPFHERIRAELPRRGIDFELVYGEPDPFEGSKVKMAYPDWGRKVHNRLLKVKGRYLYWQGVIRHVQKGDMVVVEHAAKLIDNYLLYIASRIGLIRFGYFGHGENFQSKHEFAVSRAVKKAMLKNVTRWFAYTEVSRQSLLAQGVDDAKITVVNNTLDTAPPVCTDVERVPGRFLYIGGLYVHKRLDLMMDAADLAYSRNPEFELHIVGDGPLREELERAGSTRPWLHLHGSLYGDEREKMLLSSQAILMPGLVGLVAIDSFHFKCPILTSHAGQHSPEIAYLAHDENALFDSANGNAESFAELIHRVMNEPSLIERLRDACADSALHYTMDNMVDRFCDGAERCFD